VAPAARHGGSSSSGRHKKDGASGEREGETSVGKEGEAAGSLEIGSVAAGSLGGGNRECGGWEKIERERSGRVGERK
jgi:hypothetical protein